MGVKYTAFFIAVGLLLVWLLPGRGMRRPRPSFITLLLFLLPAFPWLFRNYLAHGNPFYPLLTVLFGSAPGGYTSGMEKQLWTDTGSPTSLTLPGMLNSFWNAFFTPNNQVGAVFTPLVLMALPWAAKTWRDPRGRALLLFATGSIAAWVFFATSFRHATGAALALAAFAGLAWSVALREGGRIARIAFAAGWAVSLWLAFASQLRTDAPYAAALGLESRDARMVRHYYFDRDAFVAYRAIEKDMKPGDRVLAFGVFQAYPLKAPVYVDFIWKKPNLLKWAGEAGTADALATRLLQEGVRYLLYQREEAVRMSARNPGFVLEGMKEAEYIRFFRHHMEPMRVMTNTTLYRLREKPSGRPGPLPELPGLLEQALASIRGSGRTEAAEKTEALLRRFPALGRAWALKADLEFEKGHLREAMGAVEHARSSGLENTRLTFIMTECLARSGRPAGSEQQRMAFYRWERVLLGDVAASLEGD